MLYNIKKKLICGFLGLTLILNSGAAALASEENKDEIVVDTMAADQADILSEPIKEALFGDELSDLHIPDESISEEDAEYADYVNNNFILNDQSEKIDSVTENGQNASIPDSNQISDTSTDLMTIDEGSNEFGITPVNTPFYYKDNNNESVALSDGSLSADKTLFSFPGRNGFDLTVSIGYNSNESVITKNKYAKSESELNDRFKQFCIGWSFKFTKINFDIEKDQYGYRRNDTTVVFADGSEYLIKKERDDTYTLLHCKQNIKVDHINNEYIFTYEDGKKEYIDDTYGSINKMEDIYGNCIKFNYTTKSTCEWAFNSYIDNPNFLNLDNTRVLSSIVDSAGREIYINYHEAKTNFGNHIDSMTFDFDGTVLSAIKFGRQKTYRGYVETLDQIQDAEGHTTHFEYEEEMTNLISKNVGLDKMEYLPNSSVMLLKKITYPTGGYTQYTYEKTRRNYGDIYVDDFIHYDTIYWYEVYKVSESKNSEGEKTKYKYEGDYSGYPYSFLYTTENVKYLVDDRNQHDKEIGNILNDIQYCTMIKREKSTTVYTFDRYHNMISEETYENNNSSNYYIESAGEQKTKDLLIGNYIYRIVDNKYMYRQPVSGEEPELMGAISLPKDVQMNAFIGNVTYRNYIYFIYTNKGKEKTSTLSCYNTITNTWNHTTIDEDLSGFTKIYYEDGKFYMFGPPNNKSISYYTFLPSGTSGVFQKYTTGSFLYSNYYDVLCIKDGILYTESLKRIAKYDLNKNTLISNVYLGAYQQGTVYRGFIYNDEFYAYGDYDFYKVDFNAKSCSKLSGYPFAGDSKRVGNNVYNIEGKDGKVYLFSSEPYTTDKFYQFNPEEENPWTIASNRLFDTTGHEINILPYGDGFISRLADMLSGYEYFQLNDLAVNSENRKKIEYLYDENKRVIESQEYLIRGKYKKLNTKECYSYKDNSSALTSYTDKSGNVTNYQYDDSPYNIPTKIITFAGTENEIITENILSADRKKTISSKTISDDGSITNHYTYGDPLYPGNVTLEENIENDSKLLYQKQYTYDNAGVFVLSEAVDHIETNNIDFNTAAVNVLNRYEYNNWGRLISKTNSAGEKTSYEYDKTGLPVKIVYPSGQIETTAYTLGKGNNKVVVNYNNQYSQINYGDDLGRIVRQTENGEGLSETLLKQYEYDNGEIRKVTDANGNITGYFYDAYGRVQIVSSFDKNQNELMRVNLKYDDFNGKMTTTIGDKSSSVYYNNIGKTIKEETVIDPSTSIFTLYEYDYMGNVSRITDANGNITENFYNDRGLATSVKNALGETVSYEYNMQGNMIKMINSGDGVYQYQYDALGRMISETDAMGISQQFAYDTEGRKIALKDKNENIIKYSYKPGTAQIQNITGTDINIKYSYDSFGNLVQMNDAAGETTYQYTSNHLLHSITTPDNKSIAYQYDNNKQIIQVKDYNDQVFNYSYDGMNRINQIKTNGDTIARYSYTPYNTIDQIETSQGVTQYTYDNALRLTNLENKLKNDVLINSYSYEYDKLGNQTKKTEMRDGQSNITAYTYDKLNRLTRFTESDGTATSYQFDKNSNISTKEVIHPSDYTYSFEQGGKELSMSNLILHNTTYAYDANNRLLSEHEYAAGAGTEYTGMIEKVNQYTYDENGNNLSVKTTGQVDDSVIEYTYNLLNQVIQFKDKDGVITDYQYNGAGQRVSKSTNGEHTNFYWDRGYIANEGNGTDISATNYIGGNGVFARKEGTDTHYMFKDGHGNVTSLVKGGAVTRTYDYDAYGTQKDIDPEDTNPFRYCGEYYDSETQNIYLRNRYYNSSIGRFTTEDPARDGLNWYGYCAGNPIMFVDPWGLEASAEDYQAMVQGLISYEEYNEIEWQTKVYNEAYEKGDLIGMNKAHKKVVDIRRRYNSKYEDNYDYCHGGKLSNYKYNVDGKQGGVYIINPYEVNPNVQSIEENDYLILDYRYGDNPNVQIIDSYRANKKVRFAVVDILLEHERAHPTTWNRTRKSLENEWYWHNASYSTGYQKSRTKDVDLDNNDEANYPRSTPWG